MSSKRHPVAPATAFVVAFTLPAFFAAVLPAQSTVRASLDAGGNEIVGHSVAGALSGDGRTVAFLSMDPNVVPGDTNGVADVFLHDLATRATIRASLGTNGIEPNGPCFEPQLSRDGRILAFSSWATNLAPTEANGTDADIFVKDLTTGVLEHVSVDSGGRGANAISWSLTLSGDGRYVTYSSYATNLVPGDTNDRADVFLFDRVTRTTERISVATGGGQLSQGGLRSGVTDDGRFVVFEAFGPDVGYPMVTSLVVALRDRVAGTTRVLSLDASGQALAASAPRIAGDGSFVAFKSPFAFDPADTNFVDDAYGVATAGGAIEWLSRPLPGQALERTTATPGAMTTDGRYVSLTTARTYDAADTNGVADVFVRDRRSGTVERVSVGEQGQLADMTCSPLGISANGSRVAFGSRATNLVVGDGNAASDVFVRDRCRSATAITYGNGFAGTGGLVPALGLIGAPVIGTVPSLALGNPTATTTPAILLLGTQAIALPTPLGGTLLVAPLDARGFLLPATGTVVPLGIPDLFELCGAELRLQALVADPGAAAGVAFSRGLELVLGG